MASPVRAVLFPRATEDPKDTTPSVSGLLSTLIPVGLTAIVVLTLFLLFRTRFKRVYAPRTFVGGLRSQERSPALPSGFGNWFKDFLTIPDTYILNHHSLDAYLFLRYLKMASAMAFVGCCITWPVLFPVHATGGGGKQQLELLQMSNISQNQKNRYYANCFTSWVYFGFILYMIYRESIYFINIRQAYLLSPLYANRLSSRTVLFTSVPEPYLNEAKLRQMLGKKVRNVWLVSDTKEIEELVKERDKVAMKLEAAETKLIKVANANHVKATKKNKAPARDAEQGHGDIDGASGSIASQFIKPKQRPSHRLKFLIGKKVDTIDWSRAELQTLIPKVEAQQNSLRAGQGKFVNSVFVEFESQAAAQSAFQTVAHHIPLHMAPRYVGVSPGEVIWSNLRIKWWELITRKMATTAFITVMIIFWAVPVAFVASISNIDSLIGILPFLKFINSIPSAIRGVVTGLLPVVLMAVLIALVPVIMRLMAKLGGAPTLSRVELTTQNMFFAFQVIQVFLVTTLGSAASAVVGKIKDDPSSATSLLANNLPKASNFYISYFILQGLTISSFALLQIATLIIGKILGRILDGTARKVWHRWTTLASLGWGSVFPPFTLMVVIAIIYSCIAPLVCGFAAVGLYLIYLAFRYNLLFVFNCNIDTKGLIYIRALKQTMTGIYISSLCLIGLFGIATAIGPLILQIIFTVFVIIFHISLNSALDPLLYALPKSLEAEEEHLLSLENGRTNGDTSYESAGSPKSVDEKVVTRGESAETHPATHKRPNFLAKFLHPDKYCDYHTLRRLVPKNFAEISYSPEIERDAYHHPSVGSPTPLLWIPRDPLGISRQEVAHTSRVIPMTDEGAVLNDKGKIIVDYETNPPIHEEKIYY
ncbi:MAG: hypothetical protein M1814_000107 [Vezdaea aestivalis]|nr:MAG: hypothetical protein M1814_000107 [Vezdaea aestivalis]